MNPHDLELILRDPALPGLRTAMDPEAVAALLRRYGAPFEVLRVTPTYLRYKPAQSCLAGFDVTTAAGILPVYVKAYRAEESDKLAKAGERFSDAGKSSGGGFVVGEEQLLISYFPHDAVLRALRRLKTDGDRRHLLGDLFGRDAAWRSGDLLPITYKPERRYVGRLDVASAPVAVVKCYEEAAYEGLVARSEALHDAGPLRLARIVGRSDRYHALAFGWMTGERLTEAMHDGWVKAEDLYRVGQALAALHGQSVEGLPVRTQEDEMRQLRAVADLLGYLLPDRAAYVQGVLARLLAGVAGREALSGPTHGDFYAKQVLLDGEEVRLLDFDEAVFDHSLVDVGNFVAHLHRDRMRKQLDAPSAAAYETAFIAGYGASAGTSATQDWPFFAAAGLFKLAPHPFRFREEAWPERVLDIVKEVERMLGESSEAPAWHVASIDAAMPYLEATLEPARATEALRDLPDVEIREARLLRRKAGRRALVAYTLDCAGREEQWLGKIRAKGLDRATHRTMTSLWEQGFNRHNPAGVSVPEPLGVVPAWNMVLQRAESGVSASACLREADGESVARRIGEALAYLHTHGVEVERRHLMVDEMRILSERLAAVGLKRPEWAGRLDAVLRGCQEVAASLPEPALRPIHRDFYADNVLIDGPRVVLLDLDLYTMGDPAVDAGNFIAHLVEQGFREADNPLLLMPHAHVFREAYLHASPDVPRESVDAYTTLALARHISISLGFPNRERYAPAILALVEARLSVQNVSSTPLFVEVLP